MVSWKIESKEKLHESIRKDMAANLGNKPITAEMRFRSSFPYLVCQYLKVLRTMEYTCFRRDSSKSKLRRIYYAQKVKLLDRRKNRLGLKLGIEIPINHVAPGVRIAHPNVILNGYVDEGCVFHGNNVLGNKRTGDKEAVPKLGKHVDVGVGAMVIGNVEIADGCILGAGAVVTKSFMQSFSVICGVPAKNIS